MVCGKEKPWKEDLGPAGPSWSFFSSSVQPWSVSPVSLKSNFANGVVFIVVVIFISFQVVVFIIDVIIFSFHVVVVYTFQHLCWVSTIPLLSFLFFSLLFTYLILVIFNFFLSVICCPFLFLLFFLLFTFLRFINFALKPHYLSLKKIGQNFAFSLLKGTPAWRNTLFATYISFGCLLFAPECDIFSITDPSLVSFNLSRTLLNIRLLIGIFRFSFSCRWLLCRPVQPHLNICKKSRSQ